ncbi:MAG: ATP-binding protein, partial [Pseudomonadota bacterium]
METEGGVAKSSSPEGGAREDSPRQGVENTMPDCSDRGATGTGTAPATATATATATAEGSRTAAVASTAAAASMVEATASATTASAAMAVGASANAATAVAPATARAGVIGTTVEGAGAATDSGTAIDSAAATGAGTATSGGAATRSGAGTSEGATATAATSATAAMATTEGPFIGRESELELLRGALGQAVDYQAPQTVVIVGGHGTGKTRLVSEWARGIASPVRVFRGYATSPGERYSAIARLLGNQLGITPGADYQASCDILREVVRSVFGDRRAGEIAHFLGSFIGLRFSESPFVKAFEESPRRHDEIARTVLRR